MWCYKTFRYGAFLGPNPLLYRSLSWCVTCDQSSKVRWNPDRMLRLRSARKLSCLKHCIHLAKWTHWSVERRQKCPHYCEIEVGRDSTEPRSGLKPRQYISLAYPSSVRYKTHEHVIDAVLTRTYNLYICAPYTRTYCLCTSKHSLAYFKTWNVAYANVYSDVRTLLCML